MWKPFFITLLAEVCLFGVGLMTVPGWIGDNDHIWLPIAFAALMAMMCWEHWPKWMQLAQRHRWLDMEQGGRYYRDLMVDLGMSGGVAMFDLMSSPRQDQPTSNPVAGAFRWVVHEAVNEGVMEVWGVPENGSKPQRITSAEDDMNAYRRFRSGDGMFLMMDGVYYTDLKIKRSSIRSYVEHVREHDEQLKNRQRQRKA